MLKLGLIKEGKTPPDNRVALTPKQCKWLQENHPVEVYAQSSPTRCFSDAEYNRSGVKVVDDVSHCDLLLGIKEVPYDQIIAGKTYMIFSHTCKLQPYNRRMMQTFLAKNCTLIDYERLRHEDGQRIIGFGFFAGVVGAHNGLMIYGQKTGTFSLDRVHKQKDFKELVHTYFGLKLPNLKVAVTGSGRVAHGIVEIMNLAGVIEVEKEEYLEREFSYPVYVQLKGSDLYRNKKTGGYNRDEFHDHPELYECLFPNYISSTDLLVNGIYWDNDVPRLFEKEAVSQSDFRIKVIADITDDSYGSVPINYGDQSIDDPVYGVDKKTFEKTAPYLPETVDVMAVGNLPNELPRDASRYFGEQLMKYILPDLLTGSSPIVSSATLVKDGKLQPEYDFLKSYAEDPLPS